MWKPSSPVKWVNHNDSNERESKDDETHDRNSRKFASGVRHLRAPERGEKGVDDKLLSIQTLCRDEDQARAVLLDLTLFVSSRLLVIEH